MRTVELGSYHAIVTCVAAGVGIAVVPESVLAVVDDAQVSRHPLPRAIADVQTCLVWRREDLPGPALALRQWLGQALAKPKAIPISRPNAIPKPTPRTRESR